MPQFTLNFTYNDGQIQLERTVFALQPGLEFIAVRGKTTGAYTCSGSFEWRPAVKAICVLFIQSLSHNLENATPNAYLMIGKRGSLVSSLDYALDKEPQWLCDMFGLDESGKANLRKMIFRSNPGGRRPGPIAISLDQSVLPMTNIRILVDSIPVHDRAFLDYIVANISDEMLDTVSIMEHESLNSSILLAQTKRTKIWKHRVLVPESGMCDSVPKILPVEDVDIDDVFEYEKHEFPGQHATRDRLKEWRDHDPLNFMCIKGTDGLMIGYYILLFLKQESMKRFLSGDLLEDDIHTSDLIEPTVDNYQRQQNAHICVFASKRHSSLFTIDLLWHLVGRIIYLAKYGNLSTIYAEGTTCEGEHILKRFKFEQVQNVDHKGDTLFKVQLTPEIIQSWQQCYARRSFVMPTS